MGSIRITPAESAAGVFFVKQVVNSTRFYMNEPKYQLEGLIERLVAYKEEDPKRTYESIGESIGVSKDVAYDICRGRRKFFSLETIAKILELLEG